ncbi:MAG: hypothetical protein A2511_13005 [Deltaproteobacteria bacterium RIFOXYD12_FULL_50_9]|nr:MAG: hypothetical protein A2511_13005 [Deltaproteobacteria bacterium RIFOXYD12_FULL_50_9]
MRVEWLPPAIDDLQRLRDFILPHNRLAARRAVQVIKGAVGLLFANPGLGKPVEDLPDYHDLVIPFGSAGYVLRYRIQENIIYILAVRHGKESGFAEGGE